MEELEKKIDQLLEIMDGLLVSIIQENETIEKQYLSIFTESMLITLPQIIQCYTKPEFEPVKQDMQYWANQTKRIVEAMEANDNFYLVDTLKYETYENLVLFKEMIGGMK